MKAITIFLAIITISSCNIDAVNIKTGNEKVDNIIKSKVEVQKQKTTKCDTTELMFVQSRIENSEVDLSEKDALILLENECINNSELSQLRNEMIFELLDKNPNVIVAILENKDVSREIKKQFYRAIVSPVSDKLDLDEIIFKIEKLEESDSKNGIKRGLILAKNNIR